MKHRKTVGWWPPLLGGLALLGLLGSCAPPPEPTPSVRPTQPSQTAAPAQTPGPLASPAQPTPLPQPTPSPASAPDSLRVQREEDGRVRLHTEHYTLTLPASWEGQYVALMDRENGVDSLSFYEQSNYGRGEGGYLFSLHVARAGSPEGAGLREADCFVWETWTGADGQLWELLIGSPHDVQFALDAAQPYMRMSEQRDAILATLELR